MADRSVIYKLVADASQFKMGMASARSEAAKTGTALEASGKKGEAGFSATEKAAGGLALVIAGRAVTAAADFEQAMSGVDAATHESAATMDALRQAAMDAGAQTKFSATEAAAGIENLAKAGVQTSDILNGGLTGALDLAAAGNLEVGQAAEIAATALTQFNLAGEDVPHVADLLAAGAGKAQGEVTDLSQALNQSGLVAAQMGLSIEETTGTLSAFAKAGLLGSDAGTSLKTMLLRLANPSKEARKEMERFGISAYDAQGNMLPMADIAEQIKTGFQGQSQATRDAALATIFGSDAIRAANVLYTEGADGITDWTAKVNDAGFAAQVAGERMDNLRGDLEILMGSIETGLIGAGDGSQDSLRGATQAATGLLDVLNEINSTSFAQGVTDKLATRGLGQYFELGTVALKKTKFEIFGVDDATKEAAKSAEDAAEAEKLMAAETTRLGQSAQFAATATQQSTEELKAQADALEDARDAASETAGAFVNLGDGVNDAKVSLGQWINQMANQADALRNFRLNAEEAADKGLRKGLINALREAGPEGALRMRQLSNATKAEIDKANAAWQSGQREINKYVNEVTKASNTPDVYTNLYITTTRRTVNEGGPGPRLEAAGGPIYGPGTATSDSIPAMLSNGEYVVRAAAVKQYGVGFFDRANSMRLADGGSVSKKKRRADGGFDTEADDAARERREEQAAQRQKALDMAEADRIEKKRHDDDEAADAFADMLAGQEKATNEWLNVAESMRDSVAAQMEATAAGSTAGFQSGLFGDSSKSIWGTGGAGPFGALTGDIAGLNARGDLQAQLAAAGLDGDAFSAAVTQGSNQDLAALLAGGRIQEFEDLFNQRAALTASVGTAAGQAAYGAQFASLATEVATLTTELARINALQNPTSAAAAEGYRMQGEAIGARVESAIVNGGNTVARRGAHADYRTSRP